MKNIKQRLFHPYAIVAFCMVLFVIMYNNATNGFMRALSYVPLIVVIGVFFKGMYHAYLRKGR